ncbi:MAG TPA: hypothetical protein VFJ43_17030 [Bacteroidia bacterium]|nr:hypothetical protein [Bacteroidia bacterium]
MEESNKRQLINKIEQLDDNSSLDEIKKSIESFLNGNELSREKKFWKSKTGKAILGITVLLCFFTILKMTDNFDLQKKDKFEYFDLIAYCAWTILPPIWFLLEYVWLFSDEHKLDSNRLADYKYTQNLANKIWVAFVVLISTILYIKYGIGNKLPGGH